MAIETAAVLGGAHRQETRARQLAMFREQAEEQLARAQTPADAALARHNLAVLGRLEQRAHLAGQMAALGITGEAAARAVEGALEARARRHEKKAKKWRRRHGLD